MSSSMRTVVQALEDAADSVHTGFRFIDESKKSEPFFTYRDVERATARYAGAMQAMGLKKGDRITLILPKNRDFAEAVLRLLRNQELRTRFGQEAQAKARRTAHPDVVLGRYERFYEQSMRRVRHEVSRPLIEAQGVSKAASAFEFTRHVVPWAGWSALLLGLARATVAFESAAHLPRGRDAAE